MFAHRERVGRVDVAVTDRSGGVSQGPWSSLNLSSANGDDPAAVDRNLHLLAAALGLDRLATMTQVHGADVAWVGVGGSTAVPVADALLTDRPGIGLLVRVADCTPIVLVAHDSPMVGVVHCGRAGLVAGVVPAAVEAMRARGAEQIEARLGPRACPNCYELPDEMADAVADRVPQARSTTSWGTASIDVGAGVMAQLADSSVVAKDLAAGECTIEDERWFSYRRQGAESGRFGVVAVLR